MKFEKQENHLAILDGLRGAMAFWVFYGHLHIICLGAPPRFGHPAQAVDVFMILSGFLMTYHWLGRQDRFNGTLHQSWDFYIRRFFRIAPLYYLLFTLAYLGQGWLNPTSDHVDQILSSPLGANSNPVFARQDQTWLSLILHYTFLFGAFPHYVANNALPDWSIGLEMQFYVFFPFLLLAISRLGSLTSVGLIIAVTYTTHHLFSLYDNPPGILGNFPQPGFLPFKLDIFMCGICLAFQHHERVPSLKIYWLLLAGICLLRTTIQVKALIFGTTCLMELDRNKIDFFHKILSSRLGTFAGNTSYSVYLLHFLLLYPILSALLHVSWFVAQPKSIQFFIALFAIGIPLYLLAAILHRFVEMPGIALGKSFARSVKNRLYPNTTVPITAADPVKPSL